MPIDVGMVRFRRISMASFQDLANQVWKVTTCPGLI
jgi:hypothetical protein